MSEQQTSDCCQRQSYTEPSSLRVACIDGKNSLASLLAPKLLFDDNRSPRAVRDAVDNSAGTLSCFMKLRCFSVAGLWPRVGSASGRQRSSDSSAWMPAPAADTSDALGLGASTLGSSAAGGGCSGVMITCEA